MLQKIFCLYLLSSVVNTELFSQNNVIKTDIFGGLFMTITLNTPMPKLSYERVISKSFSGQISLEYGKYVKTDYSIGNSPLTEGYNIQGFGIMPEIRYYPFVSNRIAPMGWFLSTHYRYFSLVEHYFEKPLDLKNNAFVSNFGLNFGYKHGGEIIIVEFLLGGGLSLVKWDVPNTRDQIPQMFEKDDLEDFATLRFEINLGFRFPQKNKK